MKRVIRSFDYLIDYFDYYRLYKRNARSLPGVIYHYTKAKILRHVYCALSEGYIAQKTRKTDNIRIVSSCLKSNPLTHEYGILLDSLGSN